MQGKSDPIISIDLGPNGGRFAAYTFDEFIAWAETERRRWDWIEGALDERVPHNILPHVFSHLDAIVNFARSLSSENLTQNDPQGTLHGYYGGALPAIYHSTSSIGQTLFAIRDHFGGPHASAAYAILANLLPVDIRNPFHFRLMSIVSNPALIDGAKYMSTVESTFSDFVTKSQDIQGQQQEFLTSSKKSWSRFSGDADRLRRKSLRRFVWQGWKAQLHVRNAGSAAIKLIDDTRAAYEQQMQLQAAVSYWRTKRRMHSKARKTTFAQLGWFAVIAGLSGLALFYGAIMLMLEASGVNIWNTVDLKTTTGSGLAPSFFVIVTAGVGTVLTCLFWAARILVRNYLTERRLESDAEERSIMTQTFLALVKQGAAGEEDRLVVLNALFRPSNESYRNDEGGSDIALPAILAKLMDQRMPKS